MFWVVCFVWMVGLTLFWFAVIFDILLGFPIWMMSVLSFFLLV